MPAFSVPSEETGRQVASGVVTRLVLVRHGESTVTVNRVIGGPRTCTGLSSLGRQQAERLRDRWATTEEFTADVLLASQYPRAIETAEIIAPSLGGLAVISDDGFGEHDPGPECDGLTYKEFMDRPGLGVGAWDTGDPFATTFPGGETVAAFQFRVGSAVRRTLDEYEGRTIVIACHGGWSTLCCDWRGRRPAWVSFKFIRSTPRSPNCN